ncbi:amidase [Aspergillus ellipticus CBS 707.79]|uniref:amidase n=1 Tax=Aspergillus ellipticus CBS 707.79 TaxID=1448320 RepID=A0A319CXM5_9EURO|nr:amidase [Aspergillus ellipticus CBS 707.79]
MYSIFISTTNIEWTIPASLLTTLTTPSNPSNPSSTTPPPLTTLPQTTILTPLDLKITSTPTATTLLTHPRTRKYTAEAVTTAFCKRASLAQQLTHCLTETFFPSVLARAKALDNHMAQTGEPIGPLHGLPISLKDSFNPADTNAALVDILLSAGAVLYAKTNIPQTMMTCDSVNNVFGRVLNPHGGNLTAGGSSGGEGALLALRGSILGVGTDVAGSIRVPGLCCGVVGFKPSAGRVPYGGVAGSGRSGMVGGIPVVAGPMGHCVGDMEVWLRAVLGGRPEEGDAGVVGFPWQEVQEVGDGRLRVGLYVEDASRPLHPNMRRTMKAAVGRLEGAGHTVVDITEQVPSMAEANAIAGRLFSMDPDRTAAKHIERGGEPPIDSLAITYTVGESLPEPSLGELYDLNVRKQGIMDRMRRVWLDNALDVIIAPGYQSCAVPHDTYGMPVYTAFWSLVDYPACVLPFGKANAELDRAELRDVVYEPAYKPEEVEGAPCHVQLVGRRMKDELLMQHAKIVEAVLRE